MYRYVVKPAIDILICILMLPFFLLVFIFAAILIKCCDGGPVFYKAPRRGKDGKLFYMYKFRTMVVDAPDIRRPDGSAYCSADDPRITKVGGFLRKSSIDEVPQILNVLTGKMSLIGPRPDTPDCLERCPEYISILSKTKPGITGYNQAYFRNSASVEQKTRHDLYYAENISFTLDVKIFFKTIVTVIKRENLYKSDDDDK